MASSDDKDINMHHNHHAHIQQTTTPPDHMHDHHMHTHHTTAAPMGHMNHDMHMHHATEAPLDNMDHHMHHMHHTTDHPLDLLNNHDGHIDGQHSLHGDHESHVVFFNTNWNVNVLFESFSLDTKTGIFCVILAAILIGILFESIKFLRSYIHRDVNIAKSTIRSREHILQTLLYCVQLVSGYLLMLIIMTYNIYVLLATIFGLCAGYFVCQWRVPLGKGGCQRACHNAQLQTASRDFNEPELEPLNTGMEEQDQRETKI